MSKPRSDRYIRTEAALGQNLRNWVRVRVARGDSWRRIANELISATGIDVAPETVRLWFADLRPAKPKEENGAVA